MRWGVEAAFGGPHLNRFHHDLDCLCIHCWRMTLDAKAKEKRMAIPTESKLPEGYVDIDMTPGSGKVPDVANGEHLAKVADITTQPSAFDATKLSTQLHFVIDGQDAEKDGTLRITPSRTTKGAFPWSVVLTALKIEHTPGTKVNMAREALIGRPVKLFVINEPGKKDPSRNFPRVKAILAA